MALQGSLQLLSTVSILLPDSASVQTSITVDKPVARSRHIQMHLKEAGAQDWQDLSHELLIPLPQDHCSSSAHTRHQGQCFVQMLLQLEMMHRTSVPVFNDVQSRCVSKVGCCQIRFVGMCGGVLLMSTCLVQPIRGECDALVTKLPL